MEPIPYIVEKIDGDYAILRRTDLPDADTVLMAVGMKPRRAEAMKFANSCNATEFFIIGDASMSGDVKDATFHAFEAARYI